MSVPRSSTQHRHKRPFPRGLDGLHRYSTWQTSSPSNVRSVQYLHKSVVHCSRQIIQIPFSAHVASLDEWFHRSDVWSLGFWRSQPWRDCPTVVGWQSSHTLISAGQWRICAALLSLQTMVCGENAVVPVKSLDQTLLLESRLS